MNSEEVAIKLECVKAKHPQLHIEAKFYKMMQSGGASYHVRTRTHTHTHTHTHKYTPLLPPPLKASQCVLDTPTNNDCRQQICFPHIAWQSATVHIDLMVDLTSCHLTRHTNRQPSPAPALWWVRAIHVLLAGGAIYITCSHCDTAYCITSLGPLEP